MSDIFPYTESHDFFRIESIKNGFIQISPPVSWSNPHDYHGFFTLSGEYKTKIHFIEKEGDDTTFISFFDNISFFINYNESKIYVIPGTLAKT